MSHNKCYMSYHMLGNYKVMSYDGYGKIVHRPCSNCISSIQEIKKNSIKFSLSTQTWSIMTWQNS